MTGQRNKSIIAASLAEPLHHIVRSDHLYAFPILHWIDEKARAILTRKYWLLVVALLCVLLYLPSILSGFFTRGPLGATAVSGI